MRFVIVLGDASREDALSFLGLAVKEGWDYNVVFHDDITDSHEFVKSEISNKRAVDAIFFISNNFHEMGAIGEVIRTIEADPLTKHIYVGLGHGEQVYDINHKLSMEELFSRGPTPQLDFLRRRVGERKLPN